MVEVENAMQGANLLIGSDTAVPIQSAHNVSMLPIPMYTHTPITIRSYLGFSILPKDSWTGGARYRTTDFQISGRMTYICRYAVVTDKSIIKIV